MLLYILKYFYALAGIRYVDTSIGLKAEPIERLEGNSQAKYCYCNYFQSEHYIREN